MTELNFTLTRKELPVTIDGKPYKLVELTGAQRDKYLNGSTARLRHNDDGKITGIKNFDGMQNELVSPSLVCVETGENVTMDELKTWPASVVEALFKASQTLSGIGNKEDEAKAEAEAKNA